VARITMISSIIAVAFASTTAFGSEALVPLKGLVSANLISAPV
jgi:hypothetical protein